MNAIYLILDQIPIALIGREFKLVGEDCPNACGFVDFYVEVKYSGRDDWNISKVYTVANPTPKRVQDMGLKEVRMPTAGEFAKFLEGEREHYIQDKVNEVAPYRYERPYAALTI